MGWAVSRWEQPIRSARGGITRCWSPRRARRNGRMVLVADLEVYVGDARLGGSRSSSHRYRGDVVHPDGAAHLVDFAVRPVAALVLDAARSHRDRVRAGRRVTAGRPVALRWMPARAPERRSAGAPAARGRDYHALHRENCDFSFGRRGGRRARDVAAVCKRAGDSRDRERALRTRAGLVSQLRLHRGARARLGLRRGSRGPPVRSTFDLRARSGGAPVAADAGCDRRTGWGLVDRTFAAEHDRRARTLSSELERAAGAYIVARGAGRTDHRRLPVVRRLGARHVHLVARLVLAPARRDVARQILCEWSGAVSEGMLPNRFSDRADEPPEYNSVDASLWFVVTANELLATDTPSASDRQKLEAAIVQIVAGYARGTRHGSRRTPTVCSRAGEAGLQLTWMDAKVGDEVITPRLGKPVEDPGAVAQRAGDRGSPHAALARPCSKLGRAAFARAFLGPERATVPRRRRCEHVPGNVDPACRPNQIFAIGGLPLALLEGDTRARSASSTMERELWTPAGPRSLAPEDPRYRGRYVGGPYRRDSSYHNGAVWPWLAGAFIEAWVRVRGGTADVKREARRRFLDPLLARRELCGLGHLLRDLRWRSSASSGGLPISGVVDRRGAAI